jgi:hypothetical protein
MTRLLPEPGVDHATVRPIPSPRAYIEDLLRLIVMKLISGPDKRLKGDEAQVEKRRFKKTVTAWSSRKVFNLTAEAI